MSVVCLVRLFCNNCRITSNFLRGLNDKQATPDSFAYLGGDVKRLVYTPLAPDFYKSKITQPHPFLIVLGNFLTTFWRLEQLFVVLATSSKFCLSEQLLYIKHEKVNHFIENFNLLFFNFFSLTDVSNYCEEQNIKLLIIVCIKISRNLGGNFWKVGSIVLDFWQFFSNFLASQWATFQHFTSTIGKGLGRPHL